MVFVSDSPEWLTTVQPSSGSVLGGFQVSTSSLCLTPGADTVTCRFGSEGATEITATILDEYRAVCVAPLFTQTGDIPVYVTITTSSGTKTRTGQLYVGTYVFRPRCLKWQSGLLSHIYTPDSADTT